MQLRAEQASSAAQRLHGGCAKIKFPATPLSQIFRLLSRSHGGCIFQNREVDEVVPDYYRVDDSRCYLVFHRSSANLSPMFTFLERYVSRMSGKSMPVDLDHVKPFMGFCTALTCVQRAPVQSFVNASDCLNQTLEMNLGGSSARGPSK